MGRTPTGGSSRVAPRPRCESDTGTEPSTCGRRSSPEAGLGPLPRARPSPGTGPAARSLSTRSTRSRSAAGTPAGRASAAGRSPRTTSTTPARRRCTSATGPGRMRQASRSRSSTASPAVASPGSAVTARSPPKPTSITPTASRSPPTEPSTSPTPRTIACAPSIPRGTSRPSPETGRSASRATADRRPRRLSLRRRESRWRPTAACSSPTPRTTGFDAWGRAA